MSVFPGINLRDSRKRVKRPAGGEGRTDGTGEEGGAGPQHPSGWRLVGGTGKQLDPDPAQQVVIELAREFRRADARCNAAVWLAGRGHVSRTGQPFAPSQVQRMCARARSTNVGSTGRGSASRSTGAPMPRPSPLPAAGHAYGARSGPGRGVRGLWSSRQGRAGQDRADAERGSTREFAEVEAGKRFDHAEPALAWIMARRDLLRGKSPRPQGTGRGWKSAKAR